MVSLTHDNVIEGIADVLQGFDSFLQSNQNRFPIRGDVNRYANEYKTAVRSRRDIWGMMRKLEDSALIEIYGDCRNLTAKYNLRLNKPLASGAITIANQSRVLKNALYWDHNQTAGNTVGWTSSAPQALCGYANKFDDKANEMIFNIHATLFTLHGGYGLRLWKGSYLSAAGGEIGFYGAPIKITNGEMKEKVVQTTVEFLKLVKLEADPATLRRKAEEIVNMPPERAKRALVFCALTYDYALVGKNGERLYSNRFLRERIRVWLLGTAAAISPALAPLIVTAVILELIMIKKCMNFIVGVIKIIHEMQDNDETFDNVWGESLSSNELTQNLGLVGTTVQVFRRSDNKLLAERRQSNPPEFWTTAFWVDDKGSLPDFFNFSELKWQIYTTNHFNFVNSEAATRFYKTVSDDIDRATIYPANLNEQITVDHLGGATVIIYYGRRS